MIPAIVTVIVFAALVAGMILWIWDGDVQDEREIRDRQWRDWLNGPRTGPAPDGLNDLGLK